MAIAQVLNVLFETYRTIFSDPGGGASTTNTVASPPGDDSAPLAGDFVVLVPASGAGNKVSVGFLDTKNAPLAQPGERRTYARDTAGFMSAEIWLKNDGAILISNSSGGFEMLPSGDIILNGVTISTDGTISSPTAVVTPSAVVGGKELNNHIHPAGSPPGNTGPNT